MWLGVLLACLSAADVRSCDVKASTDKLYGTKAECVADMKEAALFAANQYNMVARPYCFRLTKTSI